MDVVTALLNPPVEGNIYMKLPEGMKIPTGQPSGNDTLQLVCKLRKALYGLKEALRLWKQHINTFLCSICFSRSLYDASLYVSSNMMGSANCAYILLYVDNLLLVSPNQNIITYLKDLLTQKYRMTDLGRARQFLNIRIDRNLTSIHLSQERFVLSVLERFEMQACNSTVTPIDTIRKKRLTQKNQSLDTNPLDAYPQLDQACNRDQYLEY